MKTEFCRYISKISVSILTSVLGEFEDVRKEPKSEIVENEKNV